MDALVNDADVLRQAEAAAVDLTIRRWPQRYRLLPHDQVPTVIQDRTRRLGLMRWGWQCGDAVSRGGLITTVRAEEAPSRCVRPFVSGRCLVMATAFYVRTPAILASAMPNVVVCRCGLAAFAALWKNEKSGDDATAAVVLLTTRAHEDLERVTKRQPAIIPFEDVDAWLDPETRHVQLRKLLQPYWIARAEVYVVRPSALDLKAALEGPELLKPVEQMLG